jgi:hypothetical protein
LVVLTEYVEDEPVQTCPAVVVTAPPAKDTVGVEYSYFNTAEELLQLPQPMAVDLSVPK